MHQRRLIVAVFIVLLLTVSSCAPSAAAPPNVATAPAPVTPAGTETAPLSTPTSMQPANTPPLAASTSISVPPATAAATPASTSAAVPAAQGTAEQQVIVEMKNYAYVAKSINVAAGTTVVWRNDDATTHTVTADNKLFDSGDLSQGAEFQHVFAEPGVYPYYCVWHGGPSGQGMAGTVTVK